MLPAVAVPFRGRTQGRAQGRRNVTRTLGGVSQKRREGCHIPPFHFSLAPFVFLVLARRCRTAPAERERTGATPPF